MCIDRDSTPVKCCCGCTLQCGIITYFVFAMLGLIGAIASMNAYSISMSVLEILPLVVLYFKNDSYAVRMFNYVLQCIYLAVIVIALIAAIIGIEALVAWVCNGDWVEVTEVEVTHGAGEPSTFELDTAGCENAVRTPVYIVWSVGCLLFLPIQILWVRVFKAYADELSDKPNSSEYSQLPAEEVA